MSRLQDVVPLLQRQNKLAGLGLSEKNSSCPKAGAQFPVVTKLKAFGGFIHKAPARAGSAFSLLGATQFSGAETLYPAIPLQTATRTQTDSHTLRRRPTLHGFHQPNPHVGPVPKSHSASS